MKDIVAFLPTPRSEFVELARSPVGKLYRKHLLRLGTYPHPSDPSKKLVIDEALVDSVIRNFDDHVADIVQVPKVDEKNRHVEDPDRNIGEVVRLEKRSDGGLDAIFDARKQADDIGKTLLGASAMMHLNYTDTRSGSKKGPTLLHMAITNRPFITDLDDFEEVVAASADTSGVETLFFSEEADVGMSKEELIAELRDEHGIDVEEMEARISSSSPAGPDVAEFSRQVIDTIKAAGVNVTPHDGGDGDDDGEVQIVEVAEAVIELAHEKKALEDKVQTLELAADQNRRKDAETEVDGLIKAGRLLPHAKDEWVTLAYEDHERFEKLVPDTAVVALSEQGVTTFDEPSSEKFDEEVARLTAIANGSDPEKK